MVAAEDRFRRVLLLPADSFFPGTDYGSSGPSDPWRAQHQRQPGAFLQGVQYQKKKHAPSGMGRISGDAEKGAVTGRVSSCQGFRGTVLFTADRIEPVCHASLGKI